MNQKLIRQVEDGTHCIENNLAYGSEHRVCQVINKFIYDYWYVSMGCKFLWLTSGGWQTGDILPTGLIPILLDDFFKEECIEAYKECFGIDIKPPTPERQSLPEELVSKHLGQCAFDNGEQALILSQNNAAITLDYMGRFAECSEEIEVNGMIYIRCRKDNKIVWVRFLEKITTQQLIELFFNQQSK